MKLLTDLFPVIVFFVAYQFADIYVATQAAIAASLLQVAYLRLRHGRVETTHTVTLVLLILFGGLTLVLHDPLFIKWKPTIVNWLFGAAFLLSQLFMDRSLLRRMMGHAIELPDAIWARLNYAWVGFFIAMGIVNLIVAYGFSEQIWVNFKLFGFLALTLLFMLAQGVYLSRHLAPSHANTED